MKKGYKIISNGKQYKIRRFYSWLGGIFKFTKTYNKFYLSHHDAEAEINLLKIEKENVKKARKFYKEEKKRAWKVIKTFID